MPSLFVPFALHHRPPLFSMMAVHLVSITNAAIWDWPFCFLFVFTLSQLAFPGLVYHQPFFFYVSWSITAFRSTVAVMVPVIRLASVSLLSHQSWLSTLHSDIPLFVVRNLATLRTLASVQLRHVVY